MFGETTQVDEIVFSLFFLLWLQRGRIGFINKNSGGVAEKGDANGYKNRTPQQLNRMAVYQSGVNITEDQQVIMNTKIT